MDELSEERIAVLLNGGEEFGEANKEEDGERQKNADGVEENEDDSKKVEDNLDDSNKENDEDDKKKENIVEPSDRCGTTGKRKEIEKEGSKDEEVGFKWPKMAA